MGIAYVICNLDKREYIDPHDFDEGYKINEWPLCSKGSLTALAMMLNYGPWSGNRISVIIDSSLYESPEYHEFQNVSDIAKREVLGWYGQYSWFTPPWRAKFEEAQPPPERGES